VHSIAGTASGLFVSRSCNSCLCVSSMLTDKGCFSPELSPPERWNWQGSAPARYLAQYAEMSASLVPVQETSQGRLEPVAVFEAGVCSLPVSNSSTSSMLWEISLTGLFPCEGLIWDIWSSSACTLSFLGNAISG
jgi:hypothetical protein